MSSIAEDNIVDEESDGEFEELTAAQVLEKLEMMWSNEKFAPELLECKTEIVDCMLDQIAEMNGNIPKAKKSDFRVAIHKMEVDRIRYVLSSYLRIRLEKIEKFAQFLVDQEEKRKASEPSKLSPEEYNYAKEFIQNMDACFHSIALRHMPPNLQKLESSRKTIKPNLDHYVFVKANKEVDGVLVEEETVDTREEVMKIDKDSQHIMKYSVVAQFVSDSSLSLI